VGRILDKEAAKWTVIRLPMLAEEADPLGRQPGELLWPDWFTMEMVEAARTNTRTWAGLYQQRPAPEEGDFFHRDWLIGYNPGELPHDLRIYGAGDFGVSEAKDAKRTCFGLGGLDKEGVLWVLPDIYWDYVKADPPDKKLEGILDLCDAKAPLIVWGEKGHISQSLKPFLRMRMRERNSYVYFEEVTPSHDKETRAQSIRARAAQGMVRFPRFAPWWEQAEHELLTFPSGTYNDYVDMLAHLGQGIQHMIRPVEVRKEVPFTLQPSSTTVEWFRKSSRRGERAHELALIDY